MMPLLYIYGCALGRLGGYVVSVGTLDLTSTAFLEELRTAVAGKQFAIGLIKSVTFVISRCRLAGGGHRIGRGVQDREGLLLVLRGGGGAMQDAARRRRTKQKFAT